MSDHDHPFADIERRLLNPPGDGLMITWTNPVTPPPGDLRVGDLITAVNEAPIENRRAFYQAMRPAGDDDTTRRLTLNRDGTSVVVETATQPRGYSICDVRRGQPAWDARPATSYEPVFDRLLGSREIWLRNSFEQTPAGFEVLRLTPGDRELTVDTLFRLGGVDDAGAESWDYRTHSITTHRLDAQLSVTRTAFREGKPGKEKLLGDVRVDADGRTWRGTHHHNATKVDQPVEFVAPWRMLTGYTVTLLPMTMPLEEGASTIVVQCSDGIALPIARSRVECVGRREVMVGGQAVNAWCFAWRHYGMRPADEDERFYVDDERNMVRIEWGPDYGGCWCERVESREALGDLPAHVKVE
ncbi:MAG: hypothetical protein AB7K09_13170 [Planctomycetota bacterium]